MDNLRLHRFHRLLFVLLINVLIRIFNYCDSWLLTHIDILFSHNWPCRDLYFFLLLFGLVLLAFTRTRSLTITIRLTLTIGIIFCFDPWCFLRWVYVKIIIDIIDIFIIFFIFFIIYIINVILIIEIEVTLALQQLKCLLTKSKLSLYIFEVIKCEFLSQARFALNLEFFITHFSCKFT